MNPTALTWWICVTSGAYAFTGDVRAAVAGLFAASAVTMAANLYAVLRSGSEGRHGKSSTAQRL